MKLSRSKAFLFCLLAFVLGVGVASLIEVGLVNWYGALLLAVVGLVIFWSRGFYRIIALIGLFFVLGGLRYAVSIPWSDNPQHISYYNGQEVIITGVVAEEPDVRLDSQRLTIRPLLLEEGVGGGVRVNPRTTPARHASRSEAGGPNPSSERRGFLSGRLLVKTSLYPAYQYGDELKIKCQIEAPGKIEDFDYDKYLARYDIYSVCWRGAIEKVGFDKGNPVKAGILSVKNRFMAAINQSLPEPHASLLSGILIGARRGIPPYLLEAFSRVGITHIIAISGFNITVIAVAVMAVIQAAGVGRRAGFWLITASIALFVVMTGASASVVRAGVMGLFALLARELGRPSRATNALSFTAFLMLLANPKILVFDVGFQLSFLATMGLVYINPLFLERTKTWGEWLGAKEAFVTTLSAIIMTTPLVLYQFGRFSLVAPLANILVVPLIPAVMAVGFAAGTAGLIWLTAGQAIGFMTWALLEYVIRAAEWLSSWPLAALELGGFSWVLMVAMYGAIGWIIFRLTNRQLKNVKIKRFKFFVI